MVAQQGCYHPAHRYRLCRPAFGVSRRDDRKRSGLRRPHRGVCRCYRGGDCGQRGRALDRRPHGDEKQNGPERRHRDRLQPASRAFRRAVVVFFLLRFWAAMDLEFTLPEVVAVVVSVYVLFQISSDGETNWIEGIQLLSLYLILGILFFYLPEPAHTAH